MPAASSAPVVLELRGITKRFGDVVANDDVSLTLRRGEVVALLGENGAGKTTLMNILFGQYLADRGSIDLFGAPLPPGDPRAALDRGVGMVHQHFTLAGNLTVWENIALGARPLHAPSLRANEVRERIRALSRRFHLAVDPDAKVGRLGVGECQRVEILKALYRDARVLILDEPTAVLTPQESTALFATLREAVGQGLSIVFISHKLHEVMAVSNRVLVLRHGRLVAERETAHTDGDALARLMVGEDIAPHARHAAEAGPTRLSLEQVSTRGHGTAPGLRQVTLDLRAGQITGLAGVAGNGQATLFALLSGEASPVTGAIHVDGTPVRGWSPRAALRHGIGRIPEDRHRTGAIPALSVTENAVLETYATRFSRRGWMDWAAARRHAGRLISGHDVRCSGPGARMRLLSGGNMQKLILGRVLEEHPRVIVANQPVRGLDVGAVGHVHRSLSEACAAGAAVLLISEDLDEVQQVSDVIHVMFEGRLSPPFARGALSTAALGTWMTGAGFDEVRDAS